MESTGSPSVRLPSNVPLQHILQVLLQQRAATRAQEIAGKIPALPKSREPRLAGGRGRDGGTVAVGGVYKVFQLFAGLKERNFLCRHFHFFPGLRVAPHAAAPLASAEAAKAANLNLFA